jgi:hypothetical protein
MNYKLQADFERFIDENENRITLETNGCVEK